MVFNATSNNISVISWWSVLLMEKTTNLPQVTDKLFTCLNGIRTLVVIGTGYIGSYVYISNYHAITTAPMIALVKMRSFI
jgi:hypothetical protein